MSVIIHTGTKPPVWDSLAAAVGVNWVPGIYVTYGSEIYCFDNEIPDEFLVHEMVHVEQQRHMDPEEYVGKYMKDIEFRKQVEKEAFIVHNAYLRMTIKDEAELFTKLHRNLKSFARICQCTIHEADQILAHYQNDRIMP